MRALNPQSLFLKYKLVVFFSLAAVSVIQASCVYSSQIKADELEIGNLLSWSTLTEMANHTFVIQRSLDGLEFKTEGIIRGSMDSDEEKHYRYLDLSIGLPKVFYRLLDVDTNGNFSTSHTIVVNRAQENNLLITTLKNTTTKRYLEMTLDSEIESQIEYIVRDMDHIRMQEGMLPIVKGKNALSFDFQQLPTGNYRLSLMDNKEREEIIFRKDHTVESPNSNFALKNNE